MRILQRLSDPRPNLRSKSKHGLRDTSQGPCLDLFGLSILHGLNSSGHLSLDSRADVHGFLRVYRSGTEIIVNTDIQFDLAFGHNA